MSLLAERRDHWHLQHLLWNLFNNITEFISYKLCLSQNFRRQFYYTFRNRGPLSSNVLPSLQQEHPQSPVSAKSPCLVIWGFSSILLKISPCFFHCLVTKPLPHCWMKLCPSSKGKNAGYHESQLWAQQDCCELQATKKVTNLRSLPLPCYVDEP